MKKYYRSLFTLLICCLVFISLLVYAEDESAELKFSHKLHAVENELECVNCHEAAESSTTGKENLLPTMEGCANCHDVEDDEGCQICHSDMENPRNVPRIETYNELFSHEKHLGANLNCADCHSEVTSKEAVVPYILPTMSQCMSCHSNRNASIECNSCHKSSDRLKPLTHSANFLHQHGDLARTSTEFLGSDTKTCNLCHSTNFCQECHDGDNLDRLTHPLNFAFTHSLEARGKERECATCHTERSFCIECHNENLIMPYNHTIGWTNRISGDGGRHRTAAQTDLETCMGCHESNAEQICQTCHSK
jgi:hypothetical protein